MMHLPVFLWLLFGLGVCQSRRVQLKHRLHLGQEKRAECSSVGAGVSSPARCHACLTLDEASCAFDWGTGTCHATESNEYTALRRSAPAWRLATIPAQCLNGENVDAAQTSIKNRFLSAVYSKRPGETGAKNESPRPANVRVILPSRPLPTTPELTKLRENIQKTTDKLDQMKKERDTILDQLSGLKKGTAKDDAVKALNQLDRRRGKVKLTRALMEKEEREIVETIEGKSRGRTTEVLRCLALGSGEGCEAVPELDRSFDRVYILTLPPDQHWAATILQKAVMNQMMHSAVLARVHDPGNSVDEQYMLFELTHTKSDGLNVIRCTAFHSKRGKGDGKGEGIHVLDNNHRIRIKTAYMNNCAFNLKPDQFVIQEAKLQQTGGDASRPIMRELNVLEVPMRRVDQAGSTLVPMPLQSIAVTDEAGTVTHPYPATVGNALRWSINYLARYPHYGSLSHNCHHFAFGLYHALGSITGDPVYPNTNIPLMKKNAKKNVGSLVGVVRDSLCHGVGAATGFALGCCGTAVRSIPKCLGCEREEREDESSSYDADVDNDSNEEEEEESSFSDFEDAQSQEEPPSSEFKDALDALPELEPPRRRRNF